MGSPYSLYHEGREVFELSPEQLWAEITDVERFERWWSWLHDVELDPDRVDAGSVLTFAIVSPLPYRLRCRVEMSAVVPGELIETDVSGDLKGWAKLVIRPHPAGSEITLSWELEATQRPVRVLVRVGRPIVMRAKDWAIDHALATFRRNIERGDPK